MKNTSKQTGMEYEKKASEYLLKCGYIILEQNFFSRFGEIDIIAKKDEYTVFIEVKYRTNETGGHPLEVVDNNKKKRICKTAAFYCMSKHLHMETPIRFDVIAFLKEELIHIEDAFPYQIYK